MGLTQINEFFLKSEALERHSAGLQNEGECHAMPRMTLTCYHNQIKAMQTNTHTKDWNDIILEYWLKQI